MKIYLVRHAEPAEDTSTGGASPGPGLAPAGKTRAKALAEIAVKAKVSRIYVSEYVRTQQTAAPAAERLKLKPLKESQDQLSRAKIVKDIKAMDAGSAVLVVGHTNTVPGIITLLGASNPPEIGATEFTKMFIVTLGGDKPTLETTTYGAPPQR